MNLNYHFILNFLKVYLFMKMTQKFYLFVKRPKQDEVFRSDKPSFLQSFTQINFICKKALYIKINNSLNSFIKSCKVYIYNFKKSVTITSYVDLSHNSKVIKYKKLRLEANMFQKGLDLLLAEPNLTLQCSKVRNHVIYQPSMLIDH